MMESPASKAENNPFFSDAEARHTTMRANTSVGKVIAHIAMDEEGKVRLTALERCNGGAPDEHLTQPEQAHILELGQAQIERQLQQHQEMVADAEARALERGDLDDFNTVLPGGRGGEDTPNEPEET